MSELSLNKIDSHILVSIHSVFSAVKISISALNSSLLVMGIDFGNYVIDLCNIH